MLNRRLALFSCIALLIACDGPASPDAGPPDAGTNGGTDAGPPGYDAGPITRIPESEAAASRASCAFSRGAMPWQTLGEEVPIGDDIPIDHFIIIMQENRSFDSYYGTMPGVDGIPPGTTNPTADGTPVASFHSTTYCTEDTSHSWNGSHREYDDGANDGFVIANDPMGERAMGYFDESDLPFYWDLSRTFAMSDHHHCSVLGPTWVNRFYFLSATSFGRITNDPVDADRIPAEGEHIIYEELDRVGVSWSIYYEAVPFVYGGYPRWSFRGGRAHIRPIDEMWTALEDGTLPSVVYIDPAWDFRDGVDATDEHPPANPQRGQAWMRDIVTRFMASDIWAHTAIIITYDEHGGFYDHVPPGDACPPGDFPPDLQAGDANADFDRYGFRVPMIVVSPYSKPGYVSDQVTDATSIMRLLQARYLMPALTGRDANAWPLLDMFDFSNPALLEPAELADAPVDPAQVDACHAAFPDR